jgi:phosphinothricin acetyltransferase
MNNPQALSVRRVRPHTRGGPDDALAVAAIYDDAVRTTTATFDTEPKTVADRAAWLEAHDERFSAFIAEDPAWLGGVEACGEDAVPPTASSAGAVLGWASLSRWSERAAYDGTGETSFYVRPDARGRRVGSLLMDALLAHARSAGFHVLLARIVAGNEASERLHERAGFVRVGVMREVGRKFGRWLDVGLWELMLEE